MNKLLVSCLTIVIFISCNENTDDVSNSSTNDAFIVTPNDGHFETITHGNEKYTVLYTTTNIKNNTNSKITYFDVIAFMEVQFHNDPIAFVPRDFTIANQLVSAASSEDEYIDEIKDIRRFHSVLRNLFYSGREISLDNPWLPNEELSFNFPNKTPVKNVSDFFKYVECDIPINVFDRTPDLADFVIIYTARSIDGEYSDTLRFGVLDLWKGYQTQLGLR